MDGQIVSYDKVKWIISNFYAYMCLGEDGIFLALLQEGLEVIIGLVMIFRACIALGYVPLSWSLVRVVFIHKPGRSSYVQAKSFHPINLTYFLTKTLEMLARTRTHAHTHIRDGA
jgi:hypothetical protein